MNTNDYVKEMESQLTSTCVQPDGTTMPYYKKSSKEELIKQKVTISKLMEDGNRMGYISDNDLKLMIPSGKAGRLYGLPKVHKELKPGANIPTCRPIVSQSGSNTEYASRFVDYYAKPLVKEIESYVEDSADILRIFEETNNAGTLPPDSFPVCVDVTSLYTNIHAEGPEGG